MQVTKKLARSKVFQGLTVLSVFAAMFLVFGEINAAQDRPYRRLIGKNVSEVKAIQGAPEMILAEGDSRYPINGFGKPKRTKFVSCWIYKFKAKVAYLYIDERDIVDEVFIGGS